MLTLILSGCHVPQLAPELTPSLAPTTQSTEGAVQPSAPAESEEPTATMAMTPEPSRTSSPTIVPDHQTDACTNQVSFLEDVTVPDGTEFLPGEKITKVWRLENSGSCAWTTAYGAVFVSGDQLGGAADIPISGPVKPGESMELSIQLQAPDDEGSFRGRWMLRDSNGDPFGVGQDGETAFWVDIEVVAPASAGLATPSASSPAAGICPQAEGAVVTMTIHSDIPEPRCMIIQSDQRLRVVNDTEATISVGLGSLMASIDSGEAFTFGTRFGDLLMVGVHYLRVEPCCGGSLWLQE